jgi:hypothetical protein
MNFIQNHHKKDLQFEIKRARYFQIAQQSYFHKRRWGSDMKNKK